MSCNLIKFPSKLWFWNQKFISNFIFYIIIIDIIFFIIDIITFFIVIVIVVTETPFYVGISKLKFNQSSICILFVWFEPPQKPIVRDLNSILAIDKYRHLVWIHIRCPCYYNRIVIIKFKKILSSSPSIIIIRNLIGYVTYDRHFKFSGYWCPALYNNKQYQLYQKRNGNNKCNYCLYLFIWLSDIHINVHVSVN